MYARWKRNYIFSINRVDGYHFACAVSFIISNLGYAAFKLFLCFRLVISWRYTYYCSMLNLCGLLICLFVVFFTILPFYIFDFKIGATQFFFVCAFSSENNLPHIDFSALLFLIRFFQFTIAINFCTFWLLCFLSFLFTFISHFECGYCHSIKIYWIICMIPINDSANFSPPSHLIATT